MPVPSYVATPPILPGPLVGHTASKAAVIALTTDTREKSISLIFEAGADAVVKMPFRPDELRASVTEAINQRRSD